jgi:chitinase
VSTATRTPTSTNTLVPTFQPPSVTPTNGPSATPSRTPSPFPTSSVGLPRHVLVGYWHNFDNGSGFIRLRNVNTRWDVINIAFAVPVGTDGTLSFVPYTGTTVAEFKSDVAYLHSIGKKVVISIGGAEGQVSITDATKKTNFVNSLVSVINDYGFDGIDIDLEGSSVGLGNGDSNLQSPTSPGVTNLIAGIREIRNRFGANFMLTMAPETANVQGGYSVYGGPWGAYLPVLHATRDILTFVHVQHYNSGAMLGLDGRAYSQGTADFQVAMAEMLLQGFSAPSGSSNFFPPLRPDQVAIGLPSAPNAAGGGYTQPADIEKAVRYLAQGQSYGGSYTLRKPSGYADFRGLMSWSINWDAYNNYVFSTNSRNLLNSLP